MKRKRDSIVGYEKDELLVQTTALNLQYNRTFGLDHNILIYDCFKDQTPEAIYELNLLLKQNIDDLNYMDLDQIKNIILYK
tara:strand:+ start:3164 stop:3406 length:243 start_codon:yes stop_codon:yes gene_type:complete